jgi:thiol-disulfide isomerase/thioredoxin
MSKIILLLLSFFFLFTVKAKGQSELGANTFHWEIRRGVTVVEFWAGWNRGNEILFLHELNNCRVFRHVIRRDRKLLDEYNVTAVPTIIVFKNGYEEFRFAPNIMLKVTATKDQVQSAIDDL